MLARPSNSAIRPVVVPHHQPAPVKFAHPTEQVLASVLDFYGVRRLYEPHSFPLRGQEERLLETFTPDFYIPEVGVTKGAV